LRKKHQEVSRKFFLKKKEGKEGKEGSGRNRSQKKV
jgi:hypothetical protein